MDLKIIDQKVLSSAVEKAKNSLRKRVNVNFHADYADPINRLLNAMEPGTYVRPHKHENPDKREVFLILTGLVAVIIFNSNGKVIQCVQLGAKAGAYGIEIPEKTWHTVVSLESGTVLYEVKDGPYIPMTDKNFASWAPAEGSPECPDYLETLCKEAGLNTTP